MQLFVENLLKVLKVWKTRIKGSTAVSRKVASCSSHGAPRLPHDIQGKVQQNFSKNLLTKQKKYGVMQTEREVRAMRAKSLGHLSIKAISELYNERIYETQKYRYIVDQRDGEIYRIEKNLLGTTEALDPDNWIKQ